MSKKAKLRWYQYSLRSLFVMMTLFAIVCSWYAYEMEKAAKRRAAIAEIVKRGGFVGYYDHTDKFSSWGKPPAWYSWMRRLHAEEHLGNATDIYFRGENIGDTDLVHLKCLTKLEHLDLVNANITDAGLIHLKDLTTLVRVELCLTQIGDSGLEHLEGLRNLDSLWLRDTRVTDAGLEHLKGLRKLDFLDLRQTDVTEEGVRKLKNVLPDCTCRR